jgi:hypothetical protein
MSGGHNDREYRQRRLHNAVNGKNSDLGFNALFVLRRTIEDKQAKKRPDDSNNE